MPERIEPLPKGYAELTASFEETKQQFLTWARRGKLSETEIQTRLQRLDEQLHEEQMRLVHGKVLSENDQRRIRESLERMKEAASQDDALVPDEKE